MDHPVHIFQNYYQKALGKMEPEVVNAMGLSTVDKLGRPHSRMVLFKGMYENQLTFFTNYQSNKGQELEANPNVALLFHWKPIDLQVRIEGVASRAPRKFVENYWQSRSFEKQLSGTLSQQSKKLKSYEELMQKYNQLKGRVTELLCPHTWGGYLVEPHYFEFWKANPFRLHKRRVFKKVEGNWESYFIQP